MMGQALFDYNKRLILLSAIKLSGGHCTYKEYLKVSKSTSICLLELIHLEDWKITASLIVVELHIFCNSFKKGP
jgi:hypothetical protein